MSSARGMKSVRLALPLSVWKVVTRMLVSGSRPGRTVLAHGLDGEAAAALVVQNSGKDAGRVESREAQPVDGAAGAHQGGGVHVTDDAVIADRLIGHVLLPAAGKDKAPPSSVEPPLPTTIMIRTRQVVGKLNRAGFLVANGGTAWGSKEGDVGAGLAPARACWRAPARGVPPRGSTGQPIDGRGLTMSGESPPLPMAPAPLY